MIKKENLLLYAITNRKDETTELFLNKIEKALNGGVTCIQLREKELSKDAFTAEAKAVKRLCKRYCVPLIINDRLDVALESGADGVHVGQEDADISEIRRITGKNFIIGATAKTVEQAKAAEQKGADYLGVGAVFPSPTKTNAKRIKSEELMDICTSVSIPSVAIGGINIDNIYKLRGSKIAGIAVISAIFDADSIRLAAENLKKEVIGLI